jgi:D-glycero-alpha-D-manno-heptose-7-phosphate kinase
MIICKTPFRISLFGGSTDYESFYSKYGSFLVGFAIDKYSYVSVRKNPSLFNYKSKISYSTVETVDHNKDIKHDGVRGVIEYFKYIDERLEISSFSDLPAQTGVGSSSSFVVGLINALEYKKKYSPKQLAQYAIQVERFHLNEAGGIQDQIWAAYGGLNSIAINTDGSFNVRPLPVSDDFIKDFIESSFLIYTGKNRQSFKIAASHDTGSEDENKQKILSLAYDGYEAFCSENKNEIGLLVRESWESKRRISNLICTPEVDQMMSELLDYGMIGGKLIGSGGSGFIFGIARDIKSKKRIKDIFNSGYTEFDIARKGSTIINE